MAITITIEINDIDEKILLNDITDIDSWAQDAVTGKINASWKRLQTNWTTQLMNDESFTDSIPSNKPDFVNLVTSRDDYKNRTERDAEEAAANSVEQ